MVKIETTVAPSKREKVAAFVAERTAGKFAAILEEIQKKYLPPEATESDKQKLLETLRVEELALARGCAEGNDLAWETFLLRYREKLSKSFENSSMECLVL